MLRFLLSCWLRICTKCRCLIAAAYKHSKGCKAAEQKQESRLKAGCVNKGKAQRCNVAMLCDTFKLCTCKQALWGLLSWSGPKRSRENFRWKDGALFVAGFYLHFLLLFLTWKAAALHTDAVLPFWYNQQPSKHPEILRSGRFLSEL